MPVRKGDEVIVKRGKYKTREGKVIAVYRTKWVIQVDRVTKDKQNGVGRRRRAVAGRARGAWVSRLFVGVGAEQSALRASQAHLCRLAWTRPRS